MIVKPQCTYSRLIVALYVSRVSIPSKGLPEGECDYPLARDDSYCMTTHIISTSLLVSDAKAEAKGWHATDSDTVVCSFVQPDPSGFIGILSAWTVKVADHGKCNSAIPIAAPHPSIPVIPPGEGTLAGYLHTHLVLAALLSTHDYR